MFSALYLLSCSRLKLYQLGRRKIENNDKPGDFITLKALQLVSHFHWLCSTLSQKAVKVDHQLWWRDQRPEETQRWWRQVAGAGQGQHLEPEGSDHLYCGQAARRKSPSGRAIINNYQPTSYSPQFSAPKHRNKRKSFWCVLSIR